MEPQLWERVQAIFIDVWEADPKHREQHLRNLCGDDEKLRQEVESLLYHHEESGDFMARSAVEEYGALIPPEGEQRDFPVIEGPYRIETLLGRGGMGSVYRASQTDGVVRTVALKVMNFGMDNHEFATRFHYERQALALLNHPNVAHIYDYGVTADNRPFFTMEYVDGEMLTDYIRSHNLSLTERLRLFAYLCEGVQYMHRKNVLHRDLKPSNVLVEETPEGPVPKIIDFGIAKMTTSDQPQLTNAGSLLGTPAFMSPEQANGQGMDTSTDVYALGVLLFQMLTDLQPFEENRYREGSLDERLALICYEEAPKASRRLSDWLTGNANDYSAEMVRDYQQRLKSLSGDLDTIIAKAITKDRERRYGTVRELSDDLHRFLEDKPILATTPSPWYLVRKFCKRHRTGVLTGVFFGLAMVAAMVALVIMYSNLLTANHEKEEQLRVAESGFNLILDLLSNSFLAEGSDPKQLQGLVERAAKSRGYSENEPFYQATVDVVVGHLLYWWGFFEAADEKLATVRQDLREMGFDRSDLYFRASVKYAEVMRALGRYEEASALTNRLERDIADVLGEDSQYYLSTRLEQVMVARAIALRADNPIFLTQIEDMLWELIDEMERTLGPNHGTTMLARMRMNNILFLYYDKQDRTLRDRGMSVLNDMMAALYDDQVATLGVNHPHPYLTLYRQADNLIALGRYEEAKPMAEIALRKLTELRGNEHVETFHALNIYVRALAHLGENEQGLAFCREYLEPIPETIKETPAVIFHALNNKAHFLNMVGQHEEALQVKNDELALRYQYPAFKKGEVFTSRLTLAEIFSGMGDYDQAEVVLQECIAYQWSQKDYFHFRYTVGALAEIYRKTGRNDEADKLAQWANGLIREDLPLELEQPAWLSVWYEISKGCM